MTSELAPIDIRQIPELARLVDEVRASRKSRCIVRDGEELALLVPALASTTPDPSAPPGPAASRKAAWSPPLPALFAPTVRP